VSRDLGTDRRYLTEQQYASDRNLAARQSIYAFQVPSIDLAGRAIDLAAMRGGEQVLDVGCGNGGYLGTLRARGHRGLLCGADLSVGMLRSARRATDGPLLVSDAQALPFADDAFDVALAMHMLYHVPDRGTAVAELRRVLRPGGVALVVTNFAAHLDELDRLIEVCAAAVGIAEPPLRGSEAFKMDTGAAELEAAFASVTAHPFVSELVVTEVEPVLSYVRSMGAWVSDTRQRLGALTDELERRVRETIATEGAFRVRTAAGCFVCR
jgi:ubiquinone/menaquinone biosynthesis C-methylase UbiE